MSEVTSSRGYHKATYDEIMSSNSNGMGVRLGKLCVAKSIPVTDVAEFFGISRQAVYLWFRGTVKPAGRHTEKLEQLIHKLSQN